MFGAIPNAIIWTNPRFISSVNPGDISDAKVGVIPCPKVNAIVSLLLKCCFSPSLLLDCPIQFEKKY